MRFGVLGPLLVADDDGTPIDVGGRQPRLVLAALIAAGGTPIRADSLVELIWGERPPPSAVGTLQSYVSRLRRLLDGAGRSQLVLDDAGYRLELAPHTVDLVRFGELADRGHDEMEAHRATAARSSFIEALSLWRGPALVELVDEGAGIAQAAMLEEQRLAVLEGASTPTSRSAATATWSASSKRWSPRTPCVKDCTPASPWRCTGAVVKPRRSERWPTRRGCCATSWASNRAESCATSKRVSSTTILHSIRHRSPC